MAGIVVTTTHHSYVNWSAFVMGCHAMIFYFVSSTILSMNGILIEELEMNRGYGGNCPETTRTWMEMINDYYFDEILLIYQKIIINIKQIKSWLYGIEK